MATGTITGARLTGLTTALAGRYRLERELGAGGMATVWLAEDLRHERRVAIKVLHPELSAMLGPERFLGEIKTTASLQHPHILPLFDSGAADGLLYYVMPYVDGETLRERLTRETQLPVADAVRIAREVADALAHAHAHGVVHRDVKPENILLQGGHALVADFGIALAVSQAGGARMTQTGLSLGTPQCMAPEQAMAERAVDARADVYALGAVTYEMLAGEPPFTGPTAQAIVARAMSEAPRSLVAQRRSVPAALDEAVRRALETLPADRFATAADFATALAVADVGPTPARAAGAARRRRPRFALGAALGGALGGAAFLAGAYALGRWSTPQQPVLPSRLSIVSAQLGVTGAAAELRQLALSPQGDAVVFATVDDERVSSLARQPLDAERPTPIAGTRGLLSPQIAPDGRSVIAWSTGHAAGDQQRAMRVSLGGGTRVVLPVGVYPRHAAWGPDGTFWFTPLDRGGVSRLDAAGHITAVPGRALGGFQIQAVLADGRTAIGVRVPIGRASGPAVLLDLATGRDRPLLDADVVEVRVAEGSLLEVRPDATMWATPFDERGARLTGTPVQIAEDVSLTGTNVAQWAVSRRGTVAYIPEEPRSLVLVARDGAMRPTTDVQRNFHSPRFSPEGQRLAVDFTSSDGRDVWVLSLAQRTLSRATFTRDGHDPVWTPDGRAFDFTSFRGSILAVMRARPGSGAPAESLYASPKLAHTGALTPDGQTRVTVGSDMAAGSGADLVVVRGGRQGAVRPLVVDGFETHYPALSPDGRRLAYVSNRTGARQVYVRALDGEGDEVQVSPDGGTEPLWSRDGRELFYLGPSARGSQLVAVSVRAGATFEVLARRALFDASEIVGANPHTNYDVSPDGASFAMVRRSPATRIVVIQHLPALVARLRAADGER